MMNRAAVVTCMADTDIAGTSVSCLAYELHEGARGAADRDDEWSGKPNLRRTSHGQLGLHIEFTRSMN
jgi:hypothetical protein